MDFSTRWFVISSEHPRKAGFVLGVLVVLLVALGEWLDPGFLKVACFLAATICVVGVAQVGKDGFNWFLGPAAVGFLWWFFWPVLRTVV